MSKQLEIPFKSLEFPGRTVLAPNEVAKRLDISLPQVYALMNDEGLFDALDVSRPQAMRKSWRIPIESWRNFVVLRLRRGALRDELLRQLPREQLEELLKTLTQILNT